MIVVSNTTPISTLAQMGWLHWLLERWRKVLIPRAVWFELDRMKDQAAKTSIADARVEGWLVVEEAPTNDLSASLRGKIDAGEIEAIALGVEQKADVIMIDDRVAREAAKVSGLRPMGTVAMILWAKENRLVESATKAA